MSAPIRFRVGPALAGFRLDQFLQRMIPRLSRSRIQQAIELRVRLSWEAPVKPSTPVREGGEVWIDDPEVNEREIDFNPTILFEDDDMLAIDKPAGIVVHPTHSHLRNTVITLLRRQRAEPDLTLAHRLDAETSGVLLLGKHTWAARKIQTAFERGRVHKLYHTLVFGRPIEDQFEVELALGAVSHDLYVFRQGSTAERARPSRTRFRVLRRGPRLAWVEAEPLTGRRHQIRAHLAERGFPIVGDKLYRLSDRDYRRYLEAGGLDGAHRELLLSDRLMLHSHRLSIAHPRAADRQVEITAPVPREFESVWAGL